VLIIACAVAIFVGCACEIAAMVTVAGEGMAAGAVYRPVASILPCVDSPPVVPLTCHVTAVLEVLVTAAVNFVVPETGTEVLAGVTDILTSCELRSATREELTLAHPQAMIATPRNSANDSNLLKHTKVRHGMDGIPRLNKVVSFLFRGPTRLTTATGGLLRVGFGADLKINLGHQKSKARGQFLS
jgi:hypothetical protein